ncbi:MerR family transcriptional regulator [Microbacterium sp. ZXX196]|uniref:helix-turn-helix domain-containing protein n=1 Tax=Microbacterium sp. ZXX196 TaxID=2609291 RepID=UPI0012B6B219|nr:MerR family transcriptional regulator [Microbacterium sp. ZXX196]MTE24432.1 MerR family transcriptional regulator [Microbacterium sp. ZXX196]
MTDAPLMHIGELAERTGLSLRTIRHYDEVGLVKPSGRSDGGFRQYSEGDLDRLLVIRRMKPLGYSLEEMAALLAAVDGTDPDAPAALERFREDARERRAKLARQVDMADEFIARLG